jgi:hypothetical protein
MLMIDRRLLLRAGSAAVGDTLIDLDVGSVASVSKVLRKSPPETRDTAEAAA